MDDKDLELKILKGDPIDVGIGTIHPLTLGEISEIGIFRYNQILSAITLKPEEDTEIEGHKVTPLDMVILNCLYNDTFREVFIYGMSLIFKEPIYLHDSGFLYFQNIEDGRIIDSQTFDLIIRVFKKQNFLKDADIEEEKFKAHDEKAKLLVEQLKKIKQKIKEQNQDEGLDLSDIVSIVATYSPSIDIFSVFNLTVFQLYNVYLRIMMRDNYEQQFSLYLQGEDPKKLDLKHWARKLNN